MPDLNLHSVWTEEDCRGIQYELDTGKWKKKNLVGSVLKPVPHTPCIRCINYWKKHRGMLPYQAVWGLAKGPITIAGVEISHMCASDNNRGISQCINIHHMKLESHRMNLQRGKEQERLVTYWKAHRMTRSFNGPLFLIDIGEAGRRTTRNSSFLNCNLFNTKHEVFWYEPVPSLMWRGL